MLLVDAPSACIAFCCSKRVLCFVDPRVCCALLIQVCVVFCLLLRQEGVSEAPCGIAENRVDFWPRWVGGRKFYQELGLSDESSIHCGLLPLCRKLVPYHWFGSASMSLIARIPVSYSNLRANETKANPVCRPLL